MSTLFKYEIQEKKVLVYDLDTQIIIPINKFKEQSKELGFSIKSQLGGASTLFNAGKATNFIYKLNKSDLTPKQIKEINAVETKDKIKERVKQAIEYGGGLKFKTIESSVFKNNLILIDSCLPQILSEILLLFFTSTHSKTSDLVAEISNTNPLGYNLDDHHPFYSYKIKRFLTDAALGMTSAKVWTGKFDATGGYLIVKDDGDILCYHIYNRNEFENYLFMNTKLETASSTKHDFGTVYRQNGELYFKLNLQIRFL